MHSFKDSRGKMYVDCAECERGANGSDKDKCCGSKHKKPNKGGCFIGDLMSKYKLKEVVR